MKYFKKLLRELFLVWILWGNNIKLKLVSNSVIGIKKKIIVKEFISYIKMFLFVF